MTRILIDIPDTTIKTLDKIAKSRHLSRSALIREATDTWLKQQKPRNNQEAFGILKDLDIEDGVEYQRKLRGEWHTSDK